MDFNAKLISKMELLVPKLVGEGLALLLVTYYYAAMSIVFFGARSVT